MKKKFFWSVLIFIAVFLVCYFPISSGREVTEVARAGFSARLDLVAAVVAWVSVKPEE